MLQTLPQLLAGATSTMVATRVIELAHRLVQQHNDRAAVIQFVSGILRTVRGWEHKSGSVGEVLLQLWLVALNLGPEPSSELLSEGAVQWGAQLGCALTHPLVAAAAGMPSPSSCCWNALPF